MGNNTLLVSAAVGLVVLTLAPVGAQRSAAPPVEPAGVACGDPKMLCDHVWKLAATVSELQFELGQMKRDLAEIRLERQRKTVAESAVELQQLAVAQQRLEEQETERQQELQEIEQVLQRDDLTADQRVQANAARTAVAGLRLQEVETERSSLLERGDELRRQAGQEQQRLHELEAAWQALARGGPR